MFVVSLMYYILHVLCASLDRESNPRPLAYGNTASIEGTTTLTTKPNPLLLGYDLGGVVSQAYQIA
jgi:hypothetical protein